MMIMGRPNAPIQNPIRLLLVEDDEDDYILVKKFLSEGSSLKYTLDWVDTYEEGLSALNQGNHEVCLLDYRLGGRNGLDFLQESQEGGSQVPIIILTGQGNQDIDLEAMRLGAADYLIKDQINSDQLARSIRYAIEHKRTIDDLNESKEQLRLLAARLITAQEEERKRVAYDLHDTIGATLNAVKYKVEVTLRQTRKTAPAVAESLETIRSALLEGMNECRRIQSDLSPPMLDEVGLLVTFSWYFRRFQTIYSHIRIEQKIALEEEDIPRNLKIVIFRIIQEALNNLAKHSRADLMDLSLQRRNAHLELVIRDNGQGFDPEKVLTRVGQGKGLGLSSMRERAELSGGSLEIESQIGSGTIIKASWPI
jgi:signal transduction histidine kinase